MARMKMARREDRERNGKKLKVLADVLRLKDRAYVTDYDSREELNGLADSIMLEAMEAYTGGSRTRLGNIVDKLERIPFMNLLKSSGVAHKDVIRAISYESSFGDDGRGRISLEVEQVVIPYKDIPVAMSGIKDIFTKSSSINARVLNTLDSMGIRYLGELMLQHKGDLFNARWFGDTSFSYIVKTLGDKGIYIPWDFEEKMTYKKTTGFINNAKAKKLRIALGLTQKQLEDQIGIRHNFISRAEKIGVFQINENSRAYIDWFNENK